MPNERMVPAKGSGFVSTARTFLHRGAAPTLRAGREEVSQFRSNLRADRKAAASRPSLRPSCPVVRQRGPLFTVQESVVAPLLFTEHGTRNTEYPIRNTEHCPLPLDPCRPSLRERPHLL